MLKWDMTPRWTNRIFKNLLYDWGKSGNTVDFSLDLKDGLKLFAQTGYVKSPKHSSTIGFLSLGLLQELRQDSGM